MKLARCQISAPHAMKRTLLKGYADITTGISKLSTVANFLRAQHKSSIFYQSVLALFAEQRNLN